MGSTPGLPVARMRARQRVSTPTLASKLRREDLEPGSFQLERLRRRTGAQARQLDLHVDRLPSSIESGVTTMWACAGSARVASTVVIAADGAARKDHRFTGLGLVYLARIATAFYRRRCTHVHEGRTSPMRKHSPWLWLALLLASLALVAAGCGGDDDEAAGTGATTAKAARKPPSR